MLFINKLKKKYNIRFLNEKKDINQVELNKTVHELLSQIAMKANDKSNVNENKNVNVYKDPEVRAKRVAELEALHGETMNPHYKGNPDNYVWTKVWKDKSDSIKSQFKKEKVKNKIKNNAEFKFHKKQNKQLINNGSEFIADKAQIDAIDNDKSNVNENKNVNVYKDPEVRAKRVAELEALHGETMNPNYKGNPDGYEFSKQVAERWAKERAELEALHGITMNTNYKGDPKNYDFEGHKQQLEKDKAQAIIWAKERAELEALHGQKMSTNYKGDPKKYDFNFQQKKREKEKLRLEALHGEKMNPNYKGDPRKYDFNYNKKKNKMYKKRFNYQKAKLNRLDLVSRLYLLLKTRILPHFTYKSLYLLDITFFWFFLVNKKNELFFEFKKLSLWLNIYYLMYLSNSNINKPNLNTNFHTQIWPNLFNKNFISTIFVKQKNDMWYKNFNVFTSVDSGLFSSCWDVISLYWNQYLNFSYQMRKKRKKVRKFNISFFPKKFEFVLKSKAKKKNWIEEDRATYNWWEKRQKQRLNLTIYQMMQQKSWLKYKYNFFVGKNLSLKSTNIARKKSLYLPNDLMLTNLQDFKKPYKLNKNRIQDYSFSLKQPKWI